MLDASLYFHLHIRMCEKLKASYSALDSLNDDLSGLQTAGIVDGWDARLCCTTPGMHACLHAVLQSQDSPACEVLLYRSLSPYYVFLDQDLHRP